MVIATIATVEGGRMAIMSDLENLGVDVIGCLNPLRLGPAVLGAQSPDVRPIDAALIAELESELGAEVRALIPFQMELSNLFDERWRITTSLMATRPQFVNVLKVGLMAGRFFNEGDRFSDDPIPIVLDGALAVEFSKEPDHNWASHDGDGFSYGALIMEEEHEVVDDFEVQRAVNVGANTSTLDDLWAQNEMNKGQRWRI